MIRRAAAIAALALALAAPVAWTGSQGAPEHPADPPLLDPTGVAGLDLPPGWQVVEIPGRAATTYELVSIESGPAVRAVARSAAAGLFRDVVFDPRSRPRLVWHWQVEATVQQQDAADEASDDYAARIFVIFGDGPASGDTLDAAALQESPTLCYVWAGDGLDVGEIVPSPYMDTVRMVVARSGDARAGEWVREEWNLVEDFHRAFGREPPGTVRAIGLMTDTDDTEASAGAWYGAIHARGIP